MQKTFTGFSCRDSTVDAFRVVQLYGWEPAVRVTVTVTKIAAATRTGRAPHTLLHALHPVRLNRGTVCVWSDSVTLSLKHCTVTVNSLLRRVGSAGLVSERACVVRLCMQEKNWLYHRAVRCAHTTRSLLRRHLDRAVDARALDRRNHF